MRGYGIVLSTRFTNITTLCSLLEIKFFVLVFAAEQNQIEKQNRPRPTNLLSDAKIWVRIDISPGRSATFMVNSWTTSCCRVRDCLLI